MDFTDEQIDRIIQMAWEDRTPFEAIEHQFGIKENEVRKIMRKEMKKSSFIMWRERVKSRKLNINHFLKQIDLNQKIKND